MWLWQRVTVKNAMFAFMLLFALQAIAAPGLCALHDQASTPIETSDFFSPAAKTLVQQATAVSARIDVRGSESRHEDTELEPCDVPVLPAADTPVPAPGAQSMVVDMAPAWQQARLQPPSSGSAVPARWTRMAPPPAQSSPLDIAPRLRI